MNEWEKLQKGLLYFDLDDSLAEVRHHADDLLRLFNQTTYRDHELRLHLLRQILGSIGEQSSILPPFTCEFGKNISIRSNTFINNNFIAVDGGKIAIGSYVLIGPRVSIFTVNHPFLSAQRELGLCIAKPVSIGDHCWIGGDVTISPGAHIGNCCVIGCGSVVTGDIPDHSLAAGNPCRPIRTITEKDFLDLDSITGDMQ